MHCCRPDQPFLQLLAFKYHPLFHPILSYQSSSHTTNSFPSYKPSHTSNFLIPFHHYSPHFPKCLPVANLVARLAVKRPLNPALPRPVFNSPSVVSTDYSEKVTTLSESEPVPLVSCFPCFTFDCTIISSLTLPPHLSLPRCCPRVPSC